MDREAPESIDGFSQEQVIPNSTPPSLLHDVEDLTPKQFTEITDSSSIEVNTSSNIKTSTLQHPEMPESKYEDDSNTHPVYHSIEQNSLLHHKEVHTVNSDLQITDTVGKNLESQLFHFQCCLPPASEDNPVTDIFEKQVISNLSAGNSLEQTAANEIQSLSSAFNHVMCPALGQDSGVSPDGTCPNITKPLEERKCNIVQDQSEFAADCVFSEKQANGIHSELFSSCHKGTSDVNASLPKTQITVSYLKTPPAAIIAAPIEAAAGCSCHESVYYIKWIMFGQSNVPIITQNENGPCPLLAIMNVLLLKEKVKLAPMLEMITSEQLMTYLGECVFENMPQNLSETTQANYEQNMQDAMSVMYKLQTGLDVNVRFTGVGDFEYTPELIIFDLLEISLYHGWLVDPQDSDTVTAINQCSYNQLVEKIICLRQSEEEDSVRQALISEQFLERAASQLTYHGLCELSSVVKEKELCVFFRNNHFSTLYKHNNELFLLMTDQGFLTENNVVWETLSNVDGDCHFTDATFRTYTKPVPSIVPIPDPSIPVGTPEQIDHDYQVALFLQEEDASLQKQTWRNGLQQEQTTYSYTDHEFALRLQEEENRKITEEHERRVPGTAVLDTLSQQQGQGRSLSHGSATEGQRRRPDRGERKEKEEKGCSVL